MNINTMADIFGLYKKVKRFEEKKEFENAFIYYPDMKIKLASYKVKYIMPFLCVIAWPTSFVACLKPIMLV